MSKVSIGGQAVIEGIMMKNYDSYAIAVRKPDKEIEVKVTSYKPAAERCFLFRVPFIRGVFTFIESLVIGVKTLTYSAEFFEDEEEEEPKKKKKEVSPEKKKKQDNALMYGTVAFSCILAIGLFMLLPAFIAGFLDKQIDNYYVLALIEGVIRMVIFMAYVILISKMEDIRRTFMYHGAEHKTINCLENGLDLTVDNVMKQSRFHKRCGTSFLFIVMLVSILVFMFIHTDTIWLRFVLRVLLVPLIAGISYEFIRFAGRHDSWLANALSKPGLLIQRLTTNEPTEDMAEVAIKAVEGVLDWKAYLEEERAKG